MRRTALAAAALLAVAVPTVPALAQADDPTAPTLRTEQVYFHCIAPVKVQNVYALQGQVPGWDTTAPTGSVTGGAGCGFYDNILSSSAQDRPFDASWAGTFTGNLDRLTLELHRLLPTSGATMPNRLVLEVQVDGVPYYAGDVNVTPAASATGASQVAHVTLDDLRLNKEAGDGTKQREVRVYVASYNESQAAWVFDSTEVPAGIMFNPAETKGTVVFAG